MNSRQGLATLLREIRTYRTHRELKVQDTRIGALHKFFLMSAAFYLGYSIVTSHSYLRKEAPVVTVNAWVEGVEDYIENVKKYRTGEQDPPWYCDTPKTNYIYSKPAFTYLNNSCDFHVPVGDTTLEDSTATEFVTYFQDTPLEEAEDYPPESNNFFVPDVEKFRLVMSHSFSTKIGETGINVETTVESIRGDTKIHFKEGETISLQVSQLLNMSGIHLDDRNKNSGGNEPTEDMDWPIYRMTGLTIPLEMRYENFRPDKPFDFKTRLRMIVSVSDNQWMGRGRRTIAKWKDDKFVPYQRYPQVVSFSFRSAGEVGTVDTFEATMNVGVSAAIFGVVKTIVDFLARILLQQFIKMKTVEEADWSTLEMVKSRARKKLEKKESQSSSKTEERSPTTTGGKLVQVQPKSDRPSSFPELHEAKSSQELSNKND